MRVTVLTVRPCAHHECRSDSTGESASKPAQVEIRSPGEKKMRFMQLEQIQKRKQQNSLQRYIDSVLKVLVEGSSSRSETALTGHSTCHKVVNFEGPRRLLGQIVDVKITEVKANSLFGVIE